MSTRARLAIAGVVALASAIGIGIIVVGWASDDTPSRGNAPRSLGEINAVAPFEGYLEVRVATPDRCARLVVADTAERRERGLRGFADLGPYSGMLFAQPEDSDTTFTMSGVRDPLDIAWFAADGSRVDSTTMRPCPDAGAAQCPQYRSRVPYRYAVETPAGSAPGVSVSPCG